MLHGNGVPPWPGVQSVLPYDLLPPLPVGDFPANRSTQVSIGTRLPIGMLTAERGSVA